VVSKQGEALSFREDVKQLALACREARITGALDKNLADGLSDYAPLHAIGALALRYSASSPESASLLRREVAVRDVSQQAPLNSMVGDGNGRALDRRRADGSNGATGRIGAVSFAARESLEEAGFYFLLGDGALRPTML